MPECPVCRREFTPRRSTQKFCCAECRNSETRLRWRNAMREKRGSFAPHPCIDCGKPVIGRSLRCEDCKREANRRASLKCAHRRLKNPETKDQINARRREVRKLDPEAARARDAAAYARKKTSPEKWGRNLLSHRRRHQERIETDPDYRRKHNAAWRRYAEAHPEKIKAAGRDYRRRKRAEKDRAILSNIINKSS